MVQVVKSDITGVFEVLSGECCVMRDMSGDESHGTKLEPGRMAGTPAGVRDSGALGSGGVVPLNHRLHAGIPLGWQCGEAMGRRQNRGLPMAMTRLGREGTRAGGEWPG